MCVLEYYCLPNPTSITKLSKPGPSGALPVFETLRRAWTWSPNEIKSNIWMRSSVFRVFPSVEPAGIFIDFQKTYYEGDINNFFLILSEVFASYLYSSLSRISSVRFVIILLSMKCRGPARSRTLHLFKPLHRFPQLLCSVRKFPPGSRSDCSGCWRGV